MCDKRDRAITRVFRRHLHFILMFPGSLQKIKTCSKEGGFWRKVLQTKLLSRLSQNVCRLPFSPVLLRKVTVNNLIGAIIIAKR